MLPDEGAASYRIDYSEIRGWCEVACTSLNRKLFPARLTGAQQCLGHRVSPMEPCDLQLQEQVQP